MKSIHHSAFARVLCASALAASSVALSHRAEAALPLGNAVQQWKKIAEHTVAGSGAFQNEGLIYMPPAFAPGLAPNLGQTLTFVIPNGSTFRPAGPPPLVSTEYASSS